MNVWDTYQKRIAVRGSTKREATLTREIHMLESKLGESLSYKSITIDNVPQDVAIINSDIYSEKTVISRPGEHITHGGLIFWEDSYWLITECDVNNELYTVAKMIRCNHLLKWVSDDKTIHEQWCIIEDGTKYLTGEYEDRNFVVTRGDTRIAMTIAKNSETSKFNRESRFLIDDPDSKLKLAYLLTKPFKLGGIYNGKGVFKFVLQEVTTTDNDSQELGIADYYKHFPKKSEDESEEVKNDTPSDNFKDTEETGTTQKKGWI